MDLFKTDLISSIFSTIRRNSKGNEFKKDISEYFVQVDMHIEDLVQNNPEKALALISFLQGNIFLLKNLTFELLEQLRLTKVTYSVDSNDNNDWFWIDLIPDSDKSFSEVFSEISEVFDTIDDYFDNSFNDDWDTDYDFD